MNFLQGLASPLSDIGSNTPYRGTPYSEPNSSGGCVSPYSDQLSRNTTRAVSRWAASRSRSSSPDLPSPCRIPGERERGCFPGHGGGSRPRRRDPCVLTPGIRNEFPIRRQKKTIVHGGCVPTKLEKLRDKKETPITLEVLRKGKHIATLIKEDKSLGNTVHSLGQDMEGSKNFIMIAHGFMSNSKSSWMLDMASELNSVSNNWIGLLDWGEESGSLKKINYLRAAKRTEEIGRWLGEEVVQPLKRKLPKTKFWGIGHSLGAHLMGQAGYHSDCFDRITGLDPAGPLFEIVEIFRPLSRGDAGFVDVIHTDGYTSSVLPSEKTVKVSGGGTILCMRGGSERSELVETAWDIGVSRKELNNLDLSFDMKEWLTNGNPIGYFGTMMRCGHVDFYPNMGYDQPMTLSKKYGDGYISGSHARAYELFIASIEFEKGTFVSSLELEKTPQAGCRSKKKLCRTTVSSEMGYHCKKAYGCYFYKTTKQHPFWTDQE